MLCSMQVYLFPMSSLFAIPSSYKCICIEFLLRSLVNEKNSFLEIFSIKITY